VGQWAFLSGAKDGPFSTPSRAASSLAERRGRSAREIAGQRKRRDVVDVLAAIDLQVFEDALDIDPRLVERDHLDPGDHAEVAAARVAKGAQRLPHPARTGVGGGGGGRAG